MPRVLLELDQRDMQRELLKLDQLGIVRVCQNEHMRRVAVS